MFHVPIIDTQSMDYQIEFCHINADADSHSWEKDTNICLENIKINVFIKGDFSVVANERCYHPTYGDICVLPPYQMHYGRILKPTHNDYYQLDIGIHALDGVPQGKAMIDKIMENSRTNGLFFRPSKKDSDAILQLCNKMEHAIADHNPALAFARTIEILSKINKIYEGSSSVSTFVLSKVTKESINYLESHFDDEIKLEVLSTQFGISTSYLARLFKKEVGVGIHEYLTRYRILQSTYYLKTHSVTDVCYMCGFNDCSHFITVFKKYIGVTPNAYKKEH